MSVDDLVESAKRAIANAYAPYSEFRVSSVVKTKSGKTYVGVNVENSSYGLTICAERVAVAKAVSEGDREVEVVVVYTEANEPVYPCGACRQFIAEFNPEALIVVVWRGGIETRSLKELLPHVFTGKVLGRKG